MDRSNSYESRRSASDTETSSSGSHKGIINKTFNRLTKAVRRNSSSSSSGSHSSVPSSDIDFLAMAEQTANETNRIAEETPVDTFANYVNWELKVTASVTEDLVYFGKHKDADYSRLRVDSESDTELQQALALSPPSRRSPRHHRTQSEPVNFDMELDQEDSPLTFTLDSKIDNIHDVPEEKNVGILFRYDSLTKSKNFEVVTDTNYSRKESLKIQQAPLSLASEYKGDDPKPTLRKFNQLDCLVFYPDGSTKRRVITRTELLEEARDRNHPQGLPTMKNIARWLARGEEVPEMTFFFEKMGLVSKKAVKKYLRNALQPRDIRQVDPAFSPKPALWVRHTAILVSLEGVRAIICHDRMYLFDPDNQDVIRASKFIQQRIQNSNAAEDLFMPFEFRALEGILINTVLILERNFVSIEPFLRDKMFNIPTRLTTSMLEQLRVYKQKLNYFVARIENVRSALSDLLEDDEDMSHMYLTEKYRNPQVVRNALDHDEAEMLLEAYMQVVDDLSRKAELMDEGIEDTEDLVSIHLDTLRNKLLIIDIIVSVCALGSAVGTLFAGIFGMNLQIPAFENETDHWMFPVTAISILGLMISTIIGVLLYLKKRKLFY